MVNTTFNSLRFINLYQVNKIYLTIFRYKDEKTYFYILNTLTNIDALKNQLI